LFDASSSQKSFGEYLGSTWSVNRTGLHVKETAKKTPLPANTTDQKILEELTGEKSTSTFRPYSRVLLEAGLINDFDDLIPLIQKFRNGASTYDEVRHRLKEHFKPKILDLTTNPRLSLEEQHQAFTKLASGLANKDKGTLTELWYQRVHAPNATGQKEINQVALERQGIQLQKNRQPDLIDGDTIIEVKSTHAALESRDKDQFADNVKLIDNRDGTLIPFNDGTSARVKQLKLVFTSPSGAKANAKWVSEFFEDAKEIIADRVTFEVFNLKGERLVIDSDNYKKWAKNLQSWLEGKVKI
jgi:hypothetical protein